MYRFVLVTLVSVVIAFARVVAFARGNSVTARDAVMAAHPVVGVWQVVTGVGEDTFPSVVILYADGTYTEVLPWGSIVIGAWQPTGERTIVFAQVFNSLTDDGELIEGQTRGTMEVDETGATLTVETVSVGRFQDGRIDFTDDRTPTTATRLTARPMLTLDELLALTETPGAATPTAGTPAP